jgi:hypothetical protein
LRVTIVIDDQLLKSARRRARDRGETLGQVIEDSLRRESAMPAYAEPEGVPVFRGGGGVHPGVDTTSNRSLREAVHSEFSITRGQ